MIDKLKECDKCSGYIKEGRCPCGFWFDASKIPPFMETLATSIWAFDQYSEQNDLDMITGDHFSGNCFAFFKGDYEDCVEVQNFIRDLIDGKDNV